MKNDPLASLNGVLLNGLEFCALTYAIFERLSESSDGANRLRLRKTSTEKKLLEELFSICRYIQTYYRAGRYISVRWVDGSQSFDAEIHQEGWYITQGYYPKMAYLEVTTAMHEHEHWIWKLLSEGKAAFAPEGIEMQKGKLPKSSPVSFTNNELIEVFAPIVLCQITKKAEIAYPPNTSLVIQCSLNSLYTAEDWERLVSAIRLSMPEHPFRDILVFDGTTQRTTSL